MTDCLIVGGGLIGMLTARELQDEGAQVTILEQGRMGGESTWAGGGILSPLYPWRYPDSVNRLAKLSQQIYPQLAQILFEETGVDPQYQQSGLLVLDTDEKEKAVKWSQDFDMRLEAVSGKEGMNQIESAISGDHSSALWMSDIAQMRNPRLIKALVSSLKSRNITYSEHCKVEALSLVEGRVQGVVADGQVYNADRVIITAGAWSGEFLQGFQPPVIEPVKGQMILFKAEPDVLKRIVLYRGHYLIPRQDGRILAGSTLEYTGFEKQTTQPALQELQQAAIEIVPSLQDFAIEHHWAGLRPGTHSGIPYICEHPDIQGLYINSGHFRNGVILGIASVRLLQDLISGRSSQIDPDPYGLNADH